MKNLYQIALQTVSPIKLKKNGEAGHVGCALETVGGVVFTGICIDVPCSIGICAEQAAITSPMLLIKDELKSNRKNFEGIVSEFSTDERLSALLVEHDMNVRLIPEDSLKQFRYSIGQIRSFYYTRNALDILKNSMLMQKISDKEFLLSLIDVYEALEGFKLSMNGYYDMKEDAAIPFYLTLTDEQTNTVNEGKWEAWEIYLSDRKLRNFLKIPQGYFIPGYQERIEQKIDKMIQTIEQKYGSR